MAYAKSVRPTRLHSGALPDPGKLFDGPFYLYFPNCRSSFPNRVQAASEPTQQYLLLHGRHYLARYSYCPRSLLISDLFKTSQKDVTVNMASSYLDLSPLYGSSQAEQNLLRTFQNGTISPDSYSDKRLEIFPPGVAALLVCFNRFHNYVVQNLAIIDEGGRFPIPNKDSITASVKAAKPELTDAEIAAEVEREFTTASKKFDHDLFNTARL
jgi:hypothetical protein